LFSSVHFGFPVSRSSSGHWRLMLIVSILRDVAGCYLEITTSQTPLRLKLPTSHHYLSLGTRRGAPTEGCWKGNAPRTGRDTSIWDPLKIPEGVQGFDIHGSEGRHGLLKAIAFPASIPHQGRALLDDLQNLRSAIRI
jgi:hypothetical protein